MLNNLMSLETLTYPAVAYAASKMPHADKLFANAQTSVVVSLTLASTAILKVLEDRGFFQSVAGFSIVTGGVAFASKAYEAKNLTPTVIISVAAFTVATKATFIALNYLATAFGSSFKPSNPPPTREPVPPRSPSPTPGPHPVNGTIPEPEGSEKDLLSFIETLHLFPNVLFPSANEEEDDKLCMDALNAEDYETVVKTGVPVDFFDAIEKQAFDEAYNLIPEEQIRPHISQETINLFLKETDGKKKLIYLFGEEYIEALIAKDYEQALKIEGILPVVKHSEPDSEKRIEDKGNLTSAVNTHQPPKELAKDKQKALIQVDVPVNPQLKDKPPSSPNLNPPPAGGSDSEEDRVAASEILNLFKFTEVTHQTENKRSKLNSEELDFELSGDDSSSTSNPPALETPLALTVPTASTSSAPALLPKDSLEPRETKPSSILDDLLNEYEMGQKVEDPQQTPSAEGTPERPTRRATRKERISTLQLNQLLEGLN